MDNNAPTIDIHITCDDAGLSRGIDQVIVDLHTQGLISSASIMPNMPNLGATYAEFSAYPNLELGAHLTLTEGQPLTDDIHDTMLINSAGTFQGRLAVVATGLRMSAEVQRAIFRELDAQMQGLVRAGIHPKHITTHHQFHILPTYRRMVIDLAQTYNVDWIRNYHLRRAIIPQNFMLTTTSQDKPEPITMPDYLVLVQAWVGRSPQRLLNLILRLTGVIEMIVHPSLSVDEHFPSGVMYSAHDRAKEVTFLKDWFTLVQPHIGHRIRII